MEEENVFPIITLGDSAVGKTSIIRRYIDNVFDKGTISTLGLHSSYKEVEIKKNIKVKLKLIDTAGQERFKCLAKSYYKNSEAVLLIFSLNNKESFEHISNWFTYFKENNNKSEQIPKYLIGNKNDLIKERKVKQEDINKLCEMYNCKYFETSALNNSNIDILFNDIAQILYENNKNKKSQSSFSIGKKNNMKKDSHCILCSNDL